MLPQPKLCIACRWHDGHGWHKCLHRENIEISLIDGKDIALQTIEHCRNIGHCGPTGAHWEARE